MSQAKNNVIAEITAISRNRYEMAVQKRAVEIERKINKVHLPAELQDYGVTDEGLQKSIIALRTLENILNEAPLTLKAFFLESRSKGLQNIFDELNKSENHG